MEILLSSLFGLLRHSLEIVGNRILILMVDGRAAKKAKINAIWEQLNAKEPLPIVKISNSNLQKVIKEKKSTKSVPVGAQSLSLLCEKLCVKYRLKVLFAWFWCLRVTSEQVLLFSQMSFFLTTREAAGLDDKFGPCPCTSIDS